jgi:hypothetical protein
MKAGGTYRLHQIGAAQWRKWALAAELSPEEPCRRIDLRLPRVAQNRRAK